jgi:hypothetical protein
MQSDIQQRQEGVMLQIRNLKFKAILWGFLADTLGTMAVATVLFLSLAAAGIPAAEIAVRMRGLSGLLLMLILGLGFTLFGGYVAGRSAGQFEVLHGAIVAGVGMVLGLFLREPGLPLWYEIISFAAMLPVGVAGGYIAGEDNLKRKQGGNK